MGAGIGNATTGLARQGISRGAGNASTATKLKAISNAITGLSQAAKSRVGMATAAGEIAGSLSSA